MTATRRKTGAQEPEQPFRIGIGWLFFALVALGLLFFLPSLHIRFVSDDISHILEASENLIHPSRPYYRPLTELSLHLDRILWGMKPFGFHLTNLLIHLANTLLVVALGRQLGLGRPAAVLSGFLFLLHPVHGQAIFWISGRTDLLCTLFYMLGLLVFFKQRLQPGWKGLLGSTLLLLALFSKEMAVSFPLVVGSAAWCFSRSLPLPARIGQFWKQSILFWLVVGAFVAFRLVAAGGQALSNPFHQGVHPLEWMRNAAVFAAILILPAGYRQLGEWAMAHPVAFLPLGLAALAGLIWLLLHLRQQPALLFLFLFLVLSLLPVIRFAMRWYAYLPSVAFCLLLGSFFGLGWQSGWAPRRLGWRAAALVLILGFALFLFRQQRDWVVVSRRADALADRLAECMHVQKLDAAYLALVPSEVRDVPVFRYGLEKNLRYRVGVLSGTSDSLQVRALSYARFNTFTDFFRARWFRRREAVLVDIGELAGACLEFPYQPAVLSGRLPLKVGLTLHRPEADTRLLDVANGTCARRVAVFPRYDHWPVLAVTSDSIAFLKPERRE